MAPSTQCALPSFLLPTECARVFHTGGARLVLCGKNWERLENLYDALISVADPSKVRPPAVSSDNSRVPLTFMGC